MPGFLAQASVSGLVSVTTDIQLHVHKRVERFLFQDHVGKGSVPIAYLESQTPDPRHLLGIIHGPEPLAHYLVASSKNDVDKFTGLTYTSTSPDILATNKFVTDANGERQPLWYKHKLPAGVQDAQVRRVSSGAVPEYSGVLISLEESAVYTNYRNFFDPDTGAWLIYYVDYTTADDRSMSELLSPQPAVTLGTIDDIDPDTGDYYAGLAVYDRAVSGIGWEFSFNVHGTYWVRKAENATLTLKMPAQFATDDSWFLRVTNGDLRDGGSRYRVSEWAAQPFFPGSPYRRAVNTRMRWVNDNTLHAGRRGMTEDETLGLYLEIYVYRDDDVLHEIWTTDSSKDGSFLNGVPYRVFLSGSTDADSGLVHPGFRVFPGWEYYGSYSYVANDYELETVDFNPILNPKLRDGSYAIYCLPDVVDGEESIHWVYIKHGKVLETSQGDGATSYTNLQLTDSLGAYNPDSVIGMSAATFLSTNLDAMGAKFLGGVGLKNIPNLWDVFDVDVRRWGPRLDPDRESELFKQNPRMLYTDLGYGLLGQQVPGPGVVVVDVPIDLLEGYGGHLSEDDVREHLERYLAATSYAYINWTYPAPELMITNESSGVVDAIASFEGGETYRFLRRESESDPWTELDTDTPVGPADVVFQDTTVTPGNKYWYAVQVDSYPVNNATRIEVI